MVWREFLKIFDQPKEVAGARRKSHDVDGEAAAVADVFDVIVLRPPSGGAVLRDGDQLENGVALVRCHSAR